MQSKTILLQSMIGEIRKIEVVTGDMNEADGADHVLRELGAIDQTPSGEPLPGPRLLSTMAEKRQSFYKNDLPNPWLKTRVEGGGSHASH